MEIIFGLFALAFLFIYKMINDHSEEILKKIEQNGKISK